MLLKAALAKSSSPSCPGACDMRWKAVATFTPFICPRCVATIFRTSRPLLLPATTSSLLIRFWLAEALLGSRARVEPWELEAEAAVLWLLASESGGIHAFCMGPGIPMLGQGCGITGTTTGEASTIGTAIPTSPPPWRHGDLVWEPLLSGETELRSLSNDDLAVEGELERELLPEAGRKFISTSVMMAGHETVRGIGPSSGSWLSPWQCTKVHLVLIRISEERVSMDAIRDTNVKLNLRLESTADGGNKQNKLVFTLGRKGEHIPLNRRALRCFPTFQNPHQRLSQVCDLCASACDETVTDVAMKERNNSPALAATCGHATQLFSPSQYACRHKPQGFAATQGLRLA